MVDSTQVMFWRENIFRLILCISHMLASLYSTKLEFFKASAGPRVIAGQKIRVDPKAGSYDQYQYYIGARADSGPTLVLNIRDALIGFELLMH